MIQNRCVDDIWLPSSCEVLEEELVDFLNEKKIVCNLLGIQEYNTLSIRI